MSCVRLILTVATLFGITSCQGDQCQRNDCSLQATTNRSQIDCSLASVGRYCRPHSSSSSFPPKPENLQVHFYRPADKYLEFNITWQPGSNEKIRFLRGYEISIVNHGVNIACFEMNFTNISQILDPEKDGQVMLYTDCASGLEEGLQSNIGYSVTVQSLPIPSNNDGITSVSKDITINTDQCPAFSVPNGNVNPPEDFYVDGEVVKVGCVPDHELIGESALKCTDEGWNVSIPECKGIRVEVEVFSNHSVLVNFETFPACSQDYKVRLRDLTRDQQLPKYMFHIPGYTKMYDNLPLGSWQACVSKCPSDEDLCTNFDVSDPTTTPAPTTTVSLAPTTRVGFVEPTTTATHSNTILSQHAPSTFETLRPYIYSALGCVAGIALIILVYRLRTRRNHENGVLHTHLQDESSPASTSRQSSIAENNNVCVSSSVHLRNSVPDAITISSQTPGGVPIDVVPSGFV